MELWNYSRKVLRTEGLFPDPIIVEREGKLRVDVDAGLKLLGSSYFFETEAILGQVADPRAVLEKERSSVSGFLSCIAKNVFLLKGNRGTELCLPGRSMVLQLLRADSNSEYWQDAFDPKVPAIRFEGRGWGKTPCKNVQQTTGEMTEDHIILHISDEA